MHNDLTTNPMDHLCDATIAEALYMADSLWPEDETIKFVKERGLTDVTLVDPRAPPDARNYFVEVGNRMNGIGNQNILNELYKKIPMIQSAWIEKWKRDRQALTALRQARVR